MGTRFELVLYGEDERHLRAVGEEALAEIEYLHEKFSYFSGSSIVTRINERAASEPVNVDCETFDLLMTCREVWHASGGAFDITIAPLMRRWGLRRSTPPPLREGVGGWLKIDDCDTRSDPPPGPLPEREEEFVHGAQHVHLNATSKTIRFTLPGIELDLGGIAKGYALDRATAILRENNVTTALIHGGTSTVVAIGAPPHQDGWRIRIHDEVEPLDVLLKDAALSVSAPRGRTITYDDQTRGHIIDPRRGEPASCGASTAAVMASSATLADAWSTALLVLNERPDSMPNSFVSMICDDVRGWRCVGAPQPRSASRRG